MIDINAQIDATILIVTHNIQVARTVPDNIGMLFRKELVMFGPREVLLTSDEPVVDQFLNGRRIGPIGMSEEKDDAQQRREQEMVDAGHSDGGTAEDVRGIVPQLQATPGLPERKAVGRRQARVREILHTLPEPAQKAIEESFLEEERAQENGREAARKTQKVGAGSGSASTSSSYDDSSYQGSDAQTEQFPAYRAGDKAL